MGPNIQATVLITCMAILEDSRNRVAITNTIKAYAPLNPLWNRNRKKRYYKVNDNH